MDVIKLRRKCVILENQNSKKLVIPTDLCMLELGKSIAKIVRETDVILLSGPLGAGKTTFAKGFGQGLGIKEPIVSPTFTIARELKGTFSNGKAANLIHVDAYRLGGKDYAPGQDTVSRLLDELESLGLDEALEEPGDGTVVLMEWGEQMAGVLADVRLEVHIDRPIEQSGKDSNSNQLTSEGNRVVTLVPVGGDWCDRLKILD